MVLRDLFIFSLTAVYVKFTI